MSDPMDEVKRHHMAVTVAQLVTHGLDASSPVKATHCPFCEKPSDSMRRRRLNTAYADDDRNWFTSCLKCFERARKEYAELWADYYAGCL